MGENEENFATLYVNGFVVDIFPTDGGGIGFTVGRQSELDNDDAPLRDIFVNPDLSVVADPSV